jgi:hypothetical protein
MEEMRYGQASFLGSLSNGERVLGRGDSGELGPQTGTVVQRIVNLVALNTDGTDPAREALNN